jgi:heme-degrading monooxygenase HmoA
MRGVVVYTEVERRGVNAETIDETIRRGQVEFFPKLQAAPGFIGFSVVSDEENALNTAIIVWESKADADAFDLVGEFWRRALDDLGHPLQSDNRGEVVIQLEPTR